MNATTNFATGTAQGAVVAHTYQAGAIYSQVLPLSGRRFATFFPKKEHFLKNVLSLLRLLHLNNAILLTNFKQKVSLASQGCWHRKGQLRFVSEMWKSTLQDAFLFINLVKL